MFVEGVVAGVVSVAGIFDDFQDVIGYREAGGPVTENLRSGDIFQEFFTVDQVFFKLVAALFWTQAVIEAVGGYFVATALYLPNEAGQPFSDPAEDEES